MAITYHAGRRIQGTSTDATAVLGGWKELARTTLGSNSVDIDVTGLADKRYYMYLIDAKFNDTNSRDLRMQRGNGSFDTGSNYAERRSHNGGTDATGTSGTFVTALNSLGIAVPAFGVGYTSNKSDKEKLFQHHFVHQNTAGAGTAPARNECVWKWANTSNSLDRLKVTRTSTYQFSSGSEVVVLGWDPADTHTSNFWEELASDTSSGSVASLESGTFTAKKYLWIQCYVTTSASTFCETLFNNDTGSNYANRASQNGGTDFTRTSQSDLNMFESYGNTTGAYINAFMINNASNEKLGISHSVREGTSGAGNAPVRDENVFKWANTSDQITDISFTPQSGTINSGSYLKVWGSD